MSSSVGDFVGRTMALLGQGTFGRGTVSRMPSGVLEARSGSTVRVSNRNVYLDNGELHGNNNNLVGHNNDVYGTNNTVTGQGNRIHDPSGSSVRREMEFAGSGSMSFTHRATVPFDHPVPSVVRGAMAFHRAASQRRNRRDKKDADSDSDEERRPTKKASRATKQKARVGKSTKSRKTKK